MVEQLIRAEMTVEASEVTRGMLARDTHPLPKIFRYRKKHLTSAVKRMITCRCLDSEIS